MPMTSAEKNKIKRQYDFLADPNDPQQRQLVHNRLGLKPWEIAEAEAEHRRQEQLEKMSALESTLGAPKETTLGREFTSPDMTRRTYSEGGDLRSIELSPYYANEYSPVDQKRLEKLYTARSEFATDPELTGQERQNAFDRVDAEISKVPRLSPMMQEPTAQQKVDASMVTVDGTKYFYDGKSLKPVNAEADKAKVELESTVLKRQTVINDALTKENDKLREDDNDKARSPGAIYEQARMQARMEYGLETQRWPSINPNMDGQWEAVVAKYGVSGDMTASKMTGEIMDRWIEVGGKRELSAEEAKADLLHRWSRGTEGGSGFGQLPNMSDDIRKKMNFVTVDASLAPNDPDVADTLYGRGKAKVTVHPDVPKELDIYWGSLNNEDKRAVRQALEVGIPLEDIIADIRSELGLKK